MGQSTMRVPVDGFGMFKSRPGKEKCHDFTAEENKEIENIDFGVMVYFTMKRCLIREFSFELRDNLSACSHTECLTPDSEQRSWTNETSDINILVFTGCSNVAPRSRAEIHT